MRCEPLRYESETVGFTPISRSNVITNGEVKTMAYLQINTCPQTDISASTYTQHTKGKIYVIKYTNDTQYMRIKSWKRLLRIAENGRQL